MYKVEDVVLLDFINQLCARVLSPDDSLHPDQPLRRNDLPRLTSFIVNFLRDNVLGPSTAPVQLTHPL